MKKMINRKEYQKMMKKRFDEMEEPIIEIYLNEELSDKIKKQIYESIEKYLKKFNEQNKTCFWLDEKNREILSANFSKEDLKIYESLIDYLNSKGIESGLSESKLNIKTKKLFESELEKAEITLALQTIVDNLQKTIKQFSDITYNSLLNISDRISKIFDEKINDYWQKTAINSLNELIDKTIETKEKFNKLTTIFEKIVEKEKSGEKVHDIEELELSNDKDNENDSTEIDSNENDTDEKNREQLTTLKRKLKDDVSIHNIFTSKNYNLNKLNFSGRNDYLLYENSNGFKLYDSIKNEMIELKTLSEIKQYIKNNLDLNKFSGEKSRIERIAEMVNKGEREKEKIAKNKKLIKETISKFKKFFNRIKNEDINFVDDKNNLVFNLEMVLTCPDFCLYKLCFRDNIFFILVNKNMNIILIYNNVIIKFSSFNELFDFCLDCCKHSDEKYKNKQKIEKIGEPLYDVFHDISMGISEDIAIKNAAIRYNLKEKILREKYKTLYQKILEEKEKDDNESDENTVIIDEETEKKLKNNLRFILNLFYTKGAEFVKFDTIYDFLEKEFDFLKDKKNLYKNNIIKYISEIPNLISNIENDTIFLNLKNKENSENKDSIEEKRYRNLDIEDLARKSVSQKYLR
jgi:hypothetical protein